MNSSHDEEETLTVLDHFESLAFSALKKRICGLKNVL